MLPAALTAVASGGEIWLLDTANYNIATVTIGKSVAILAVPGAIGSIVSVSGPAITISAAGLEVALRNVVVVPLLGAGGNHGISLTGNSNLIVQDSVFANTPSSSNAINVTAGSAWITGTQFRSMAGTAVSAIGSSRVHVSRSSFLNLTRGVFSQASGAGVTSRVAVTDSVFSGNEHGVWANGTASGAAGHIYLTRCTFDNNTTAIDSVTSVAGAVAIVSVSYSTITGNDAAWFISGAGAIIRTLENNHVADNGSAFGALTPAALQ